MRELCRHPVFTLRLFEKIYWKTACGTLWQSFLKNAGTACGKLDNSLFHKSFYVPRYPGTSVGQVGTNLGHAKLNSVFAIVDVLSRCVEPWDNGTSRDARRRHRIVRIMSVRSKTNFQRLSSSTISLRRACTIRPSRLEVTSILRSPVFSLSGTFGM